MSTDLQNAIFLSYLYNSGGLNNQKLALLGLFLSAREYNKPLVLPNMFVLDHVSKLPREVAFSSAYSLHDMQIFAERHDIEILDRAPEGEIGGWDYFRAGLSFIYDQTRERKMDQSNISCDFFRHLTPNIRYSMLFNKVHNSIFNDLAVDVVAQLRIEKDWSDYAPVLQKLVGEKGDYNPSFMDIMGKIKKTLPGSQNIFAVCDEAALPVPKNIIRDQVKNSYRINLFWKSDFMSAGQLSKLTSLDSSIFDFQIALSARIFIGTSLSTFSNLVAFETYSRGMRFNYRHYLYNGLGDGLRLRADNGAFSDVDDAVDLRCVFC